MRRRSFTTLLGGAASWALSAGAQQPAKVARIGWMSGGNASTPDANMNACREGSANSVNAEGHSFAIEARYADGKAELMPAQAAELERIGVAHLSSKNLSRPWVNSAATKSAPGVAASL